MLDMNKLKLLLVINNHIYYALLLAFCSQIVEAQGLENNDEAQDLFDKVSQTDNAPSNGDDLKKEKENDLEIDIECTDIDNKITQEKCWEALQARFQYYQTGLEHRTNVFRWQHISTKIIFAVVLMLVFVGIYFAWVQFKRDMNDSKDTSNQDGGHSIELSTSGVKVSSPVLGVIILTLSLAFFYLYLVFVYPIIEII